MDIHDGHRKRMKSRVASGGLDGLEDYQVLEVLLFYALPRTDTNPIAHALIDRFRSLSGVMDARESELRKVPGVGENAALLLKMIPQLGRRYLVSRTGTEEILSTPEAAGKYILPRFMGEQEEVVYLVCLDAKCRVLSCGEVARGTVNSANVSIRKIVETALSSNASAVILAHNHTSGIAVPSAEDETTTRRIRQALEAVEVQLIDHIVVADDDFVSMSSNGFFTKGKVENV